MYSSNNMNNFKKSSMHKISNNFIVKKSELEDKNIVTINNNYKIVNNNYKTVNNNYKTVNNSYKTVNNSYKTVNNSYKTVNNSYKTVNNSYKTVNNNYKTVNNNYKTEPIIENTLEKNNIITNNWKHYLPKIIFDKLFPAPEKIELLHPQYVKQIEKKKEQKEQIIKDTEEIKKISRAKKNNKIIEQNIPGTEAWFLNNFPGKLWPSHPLSNRLELEWGLVKITKSLQIIGIINDITITNIKPYKQYCGKKSSGGGKYKRLKSKNIKRKSCTGLCENLRTIQKQSESHKDNIFGKKDNNNRENDSSCEILFPAAFYKIPNLSKDEYKLFHVVPQKDFALCKSFNVLSDEIKRFCSNNKDDDDDNIFFDYDEDTIDNIELEGIEINDEYDDEIINKMDFITKQALLIKTKNKQLGNTKEARKAKKNQQRAINMKNNYLNEENDLITACDPSTGYEIGYYDKDGNIIDYNNITNTIINDESSDESNDESSDESIELKNEISETNNFALDENYCIKPNTHKKKKVFTKTLKKKTEKRFNDDFDDL
jgi:uncharacterized protein YqgQ